MGALAALGPVAVTRQILREFAATTRPALVAASRWDAIGTMRSCAFLVLEDGLHVWTELVMLARGFAFGGKQVHDANIVVTMLAHGETRLLTFNGADFRRFGSLIEVVIP